MELQTTLDIQHLRKEFPILHQQVNGYPLVYLDNAATTQKPKSVINAISDYYSRYNANIHRGAHHLAHIATEAFEETRNRTKTFLNACDKGEIIFTSGTTDSINLVAQSWGRKNLNAGDEILLSMLEHHSNIVPWQLIAEEKGAIIKVIPINENGEWDLSAIDSLLTSKTTLVAVNHVSNALGTINPIKQLIEKAHTVGAKVLIDGAQAVAHFAVDVQDLDCDFYAFSSHKIYGPTGVGVLYGKRELLESMPPYRGGGEMIKSVSFEKTTYNELPHRFEAGTPNVEGVIALGTALNFIHSLDWQSVHEHELELLQYATEKLSSINGLKIYGTAKEKVAVISFLIDGIHPYDLGTLLDKQGVAVRTGHHCTEPLWNHFGVVGSVRASFSIYNTVEEIDLFINALKKAIQLLK
ncbi:MAG: cysteine desulfurase [Flavobacteriales bacterium]|mgnify:CR=1 FL=1|nr:cysteine desulfurase [Flavobacteriales bacterium]